MPNLNTKLLKQNIRNLLDEKHISQKQLAAEIGMSQPNMNKRLSLSNDSHYFTLEQVWAIADFFNVSVDYLLGRKVESAAGTPEDICRFIVALYESGQIEFEKIVKPAVSRHHIVRKQGVYPDFYDDEVTPGYYAVYFPLYHPKEDYILDNLDNFEFGEEYSNLRPENQNINRFLAQYIKLESAHNSGILDDDIFKVSMEALLKKIGQ